MQLNQKVSHWLLSHKRTLSIAESCSGGLLSHWLTNIPGSSAFFIASLVCYSNTSKTKLLKIPASLIKTQGAVSLPVAQLMATHVAQIFNSDFGIGITGIAGPTGGSPNKPIGLIFIAVKSPDQLLSKRFIFKGTRLQIKKQACIQALKLLLTLFNKQISSKTKH